MNSTESPRLLLLVAHPDDAEFSAGGLCSIYGSLGRSVRVVSVTDGSAGHHAMVPEELTARRREEARQSSALIGADCEVWHYPDGRLQPTIELRQQIIAEIREFKPDLVLTHRTCDYHPDHRAVATAVQDASYMVTVPLICPRVPALRRDPVVACMFDSFTRPNPLRVDIVTDIHNQIETMIDMLACHQSQFFEWLPFNRRVEAEVPTDESERRTWLASWFGEVIAERPRLLGGQIAAGFSADASALTWIETYEISEYAADVDRERLSELFPDSFFRQSSL